MHTVTYYPTRGVKTEGKKICLQRLISTFCTYTCHVNLYIHFSRKKKVKLVFCNDKVNRFVLLPKRIQGKNATVYKRISITDFCNCYIPINVDTYKKGILYVSRNVFAKRFIGSTSLLLQCIENASFSR